MEKDLGNGKAFIYEEEDKACAYAMQLSLSCALYTVLNAAVELGLLDIIKTLGGGNGTITAAAVAAQLTAKDPDASAKIDRMLRLLASYSLLNCSTCQLEGGTVERAYEIAPAGEFFLKNRETGSLASIVTLGCYPANWQVGCGTGLSEMIVEGGDMYDKANGMSLYQSMSKDQTLNTIFNSAMAGLTIITMKKILENYRGFEGLTSLVDVAGGNGASLNMIVSKYPSIKGINFDAPNVIKHAPSYSGIKHVEGDMFVSIPRGETIMIKSTLHNWTDEECMRILKNCYEALPENGKLIVMEFVLPMEPGGSDFDKHVTALDNIMLIQQGGQERTLRDFEGLCKCSGFSDLKFICYALNIGIMEFLK